jgi:hypothetical protein
MAEDEKDRNLPPRDFVDALVEDPANPPQLQVLQGYRGRSAQEGYTRFYVDPELTAWADVPDDAILFQREIQDEYALGKSLVWTRVDAKIQIGPQAGGGGTGAEFLQGQVAQDLGGVGGIGKTVLRTPLLICPQFPIPSPGIQCQTPACPPTPGLFCPSGPLVICQTLTQPQCGFQQVTPRCPPPPPTPGFFCPSGPLVVCQTLSQPQCGFQQVTPQCPPQTPLQGCPPTPGIACIPSILIACPPLTQDPQQCVLQTANPQQCPSLGFTCTALPPLCPTRDVAQCGGVPQPTSNPQLCPAATPNPGCVPGGPGDPGGFAQGFQGAAAVAQVAATQACPQQTQFCPVTFNCPPTRNQLCPITQNVNVCGLPRTLVNCPTLNPVCPPVTSFCGGGGFGGGF